MSERFRSAASDTKTTTGFYSRHNEASIESEAERLQSAAVKLANPISLEALATSLRPGNTILDIGAGADSNLGKTVEGYGCRYIAVEPNGEFVSVLQEAGIDALPGDAANLPVVSNSIDAAHMRFVFGWLNERQRMAALGQAVRVLKPGERKDIVVIDYDWLAADGPVEYLNAVAIACDSLKSFGFNYEYGAHSTADIQRLANQGALGDGVSYEVLTPVVHEVERTLADGLPMIEEAVSSLKEGLSALGDTAGLRSIDEAIEKVRKLDRSVQIRLPSVVSQVVTIMKHEASRERTGSRLVAMGGGSKENNYEVDHEPTYIQGVIKVAADSELDTYIRRVQAAEYLKEGLLTSEAMIDDRGMLCEDSYPEAFIEQSLSFAALSADKNKVAAAVRLIETKKGTDPQEGLWSLPTAEHLGLDIGDRTIFPVGAAASGVVEVSAFIRNSREGGRLVDMARVVLGAAAEAKARGHHTGLMTTHKTSWKFLKGMFGEDNFRILEDEHKSNTPGASENVDFICLSVDVQTFLDGVFQYVATKKESSKTLAEVYTMLEEYHSHRALHKSSW